MLDGSCLVNWLKKINRLVVLAHDRECPILEGLQNVDEVGDGGNIINRGDVFLHDVPVLHAWDIIGHLVLDSSFVLLVSSLSSPVDNSFSFATTSLRKKYGSPAAQRVVFVRFFPYARFKDRNAL